jgi:hypothetical protein
MPRYYFHLVDNTTQVTEFDSEGVELPDAESAYDKALRAIDDRLRDATFQPNDRALDRTYLIVNEAGERIAIVPFEMAQKAR